MNEWGIVAVAVSVVGSVFFLIREGATRISVKIENLEVNRKSDEKDRQIKEQEKIIKRYELKSDTEEVVEKHLNVLKEQLFDKLATTEKTNKIEADKFEIFLHSLLSKREVQVLNYIGKENLTSKEIAGELYLAAGSVNNIVNTLMTKLDVNNRNKLMKKAEKLYQAQKKVC